MNAFASPVVVCRPALPSDTKDVLEFTKFIWEGHDYIKYVWRDWLADPKGLLAAAIYGPHTVGIAKLTLLAPGQWWLEGFRVDPNYQGLKIGSHLHDYIHAWWLEHGDGMLRLMTSSERVQVQRLSARTGFSKAGEAWAYVAPAAGGSGHGFTLVPTEAINEAVQFASEHLVGPYQLMDLGWRFVAPDAETLRLLVSAQRLYWWKDREGLAGFWEDDDEAGRVLGICFVAVTSDSPAGLLAQVPALAQQNGYVSVLWLAPNDQRIQAEMKAAGYSSEWDHAGFLYEKRHPGT